MKVERSALLTRKPATNRNSTRKNGGFMRVCSSYSGFGLRDVEMYILCYAVCSLFVSTQLLSLRCHSEV